jgi:hypothetical protein
VASSILLRAYRPNIAFVVALQVELLLYSYVPFYENQPKDTEAEHFLS